MLATIKLWWENYPTLTGEAKVGEAIAPTPRRIGRRIVTGIATAVLFAAGASDSNKRVEEAKAATGFNPGQPALTKAITIKSRPVAKEILEDYQKAKKINKQRRNVYYSYGKTTELTIEHYAQSKINKKRGEYILQAYFYPANRLKPENVVGIKVGQPQKNIKPPIVDNEGWTKYNYLFYMAKTDQETLRERTTDHWNVSVNYNHRESFSATTGMTGPIMGTPVQADTFDLWLDQVVNVIDKARSNAPITREQVIAPHK